MKPDPTRGYLYASEHRMICDNWESYKGYTVRPVPSTQGYYLSVLERFAPRGARLLLYGGTPEIRDCILKVGAEVTLIDRSRVMVEAMGLLTSGAEPLNPNETFVEADWCDIPLPDSYADIALGDDAINMLDWDKFETFLRTTRRLLKPGGLFACHLLVRPDEAYRKQLVSDVLREYEEGMIRSKFDLASRINFLFYDERTYRMGWQQSIRGLAQHAAGGGGNGDHGFTEQFRYCNSSFACPPQELWEELARRYFSIEEVFYPQEHDYCRFEPLYLLRKPA